MRKDVDELSKVYSAALAANGATPVGVAWPNAPDLAARFEVLLSPLGLEQFCSTNRIRILDLGCGPGLLLDYLAENNLINRVDYLGVDVFEATLDQARSRWPEYRFELRDLRDDPFDVNTFDYCIVCGVFTGRFRISYSDMEAMVRNTLKAVWPSMRIGLGFNVMSKHVDWEREDLFHWPLDDIMAFCKAYLSRHVLLHLDYGLWETSTIVLRSPVGRHGRVPERWSALPKGSGR
jgi:SAM-dependent methyltransferase